MPTVALCVILHIPTNIVAGYSPIIRAYLDAVPEESTVDSRPDVELLDMQGILRSDTHVRADEHSLGHLRAIS